MNTLQDELEKLVGTDFFQLAKRESHPKTRIRLLALGNLQAGKTKSEVIKVFNITFPTLREWLIRFISEGVQGLREKPGKGRKKKLPSYREEEFRKEVESLQDLREGGRIRE